MLILPAGFICLSALQHLWLQRYISHAEHRDLLLWKVNLISAGGGVFGVMLALAPFCFALWRHSKLYGEAASVGYCTLPRIGIRGYARALRRSIAVSALIYSAVNAVMLYLFTAISGFYTEQVGIIPIGMAVDYLSYYLPLMLYYMMLFMRVKSSVAITLIMVYAAVTLFFEPINLISFLAWTGRVVNSYYDGDMKSVVVKLTVIIILCVIADYAFNRLVPRYLSDFGLVDEEDQNE